MHFFPDKISTHHGHDKGKIFAWMALISATGYASFLTILPIVLTKKLDSDVYVGYYYSGLAVVALLVSLASSILLKKISKIWLMKIILGSLASIFFLLTIAANIWHFATLDLVRVICMTLLFIVLAIFVRDFAKKQELELIEGRYFLFNNIGWVIGPISGGILAKTFGNEAAFIFTGGCYIALFIIFLKQHLINKNPHIHERKERPVMQQSLMQNVKKYFGNRNLCTSFIITFGMYFWWSISAIYMPIAMTQLGYSQEVVGLIFALSVVPLILLEFHASDGAKKYGVRTFLILGYGLLSLALVGFTISSPSTLIKLMILVNIGSAFIEPVKEIYFFKIVEKKDEEQLYGIYNASYPVAYILAPMAGATLLGSFGMNGIWLGSAFVFILMTFTALTIDKKY
jgi:MFS family permease